MEFLVSGLMLFISCYNHHAQFPLEFYIYCQSIFELAYFLMKKMSLLFDVLFVNPKNDLD